MATEEEIKNLAYSIWEREGRPEGKDVEHYFQARQILERQEASRAGEFTPPAPRVELNPVQPGMLAAPKTSKGKIFARGKKR